MGPLINRRKLLAYLTALPGAAALGGCRPRPAEAGVKDDSPVRGPAPQAAISGAGLVLVGPILRRVDNSSCTVFLALSAPCDVTLNVYATAGQTSVMTATQHTVTIGRALHLVVVTAKREGALTPGEVYEYDLRFTEAGRSRGLYDDGVLRAEGHPRDELSRLTYPGHSRPSFAVPAAVQSGRLRIVHGSCRKPHGSGEDELGRADQLLLAACRDGGPRPQHLFLTGDQIYADDVHPALLAAAREIGHHYLGPDEEADAELRAVVQAPSRQQALSQAGISSTEAACHLITLGEFFGVYLLSWSAALWSAELSVQPELRGFANSLPQVRRAFANVAVSMIFDDHEISDDWYIRKGWCDAVLASSLGRRVLRNGLSAYAVFQHFGNRPEDFAPQGPSPGNRLLSLLAGWTGAASQGRDSDIEALLGIPTSAAGLKDSGQGAVTWSYTLRGPDYQVVALDTRTRRTFTGPRVSLMSREEIDARLLSPSPPMLTIVLSAAPVINLRIVEGIQQIAAILGRAIEIDDEAWSHSLTYDHLMDRLLTLRRVLVLSGDVHYGLCASTRAERGQKGCVLNLVSSSLRNSSLKKAPPPGLDQVKLPTLRQGRHGTDVYIPSLVFYSHLADLRLSPQGDVTHTAWYHTASGEDKQRVEHLTLS